ncbi:MAG: hypothetical protein ACLSWI_07855 [Candidatus Gastranaerophilaceae bacterium]
MKFFQIFLLTILIAFGNIAFAQKLPILQYWPDPEIRNNCQSYIDYFDKYSSQLYDNLKIKENVPFYATLCLTYYYSINKDGSISDIKIYTAADEYIEYVNKYINPVEYYYTKKYSRSFEDYVKKVILENPPEPFPQDFEYDKITIRLSVQAGPFWLGLSNDYKKAFKKDFNIYKNDRNICAHDFSGGSSFTSKKRFVPPQWDITIIKLK